MFTSKKTILALLCVVTLGASATYSLAGDIKGKVTAQGIRSAENIAVYVDAIPGKTFPAPAQPLTMDQVHLAFAPHVLIVLKGSTVNFKNEDAVGHNVYWPAINHNRKLAHNMGTWPQGQSKPFTFNDLGDVPLLCNVHPEMSGYIIVVPTPYFALTDKEGAFVIKNIPPGQYTVKTWSEEAKPITQAVTVSASGASVNLTVKR
uniref:Blue (type 1) copper domain-containing protein n=1 Tax=mine drainage metagenome TaxID=410659 RepID=E6PZZ5_9ZZZZ